MIEKREGQYEGILDRLRDKFAGVPGLADIEDRIRGHFLAAAGQPRVSQLPVDPEIAPYFEKSTSDFQGEPDSGLG